MDGLFFKPYQSPNHALQQTGAASLPVAVHRTLRLLSLGVARHIGI